MSTAASSTTEPIHAEQEAQHGHAGTRGRYSDRQLGFWLVGAGLIALISSAILVYERLQIYIDAGHSTVCDINALLSCGTVMRTPQAEAFGFPNPFIGLVGFSIVVTIGAAMMAGAQFKKWFWVCMNIGLAAATAFIMWLWYQTTFQINALCLFCMIVWMRESARGWFWFAFSLWLILIFGIIVIRFFEVIVNMMR